MALDQLSGMVAKVLTEKEVVCVRTIATNLEYLQHIEELAVYVTDDGDGR